MMMSGRPSSPERRDVLPGLGRVYLAEARFLRGHALRFLRGHALDGGLGGLGIREDRDPLSRHPWSC